MARCGDLATVIAPPLETVSVPAPESPTASPAAIRGSHWVFCSSEPYFQIGNMANEPWTETVLRRPESAASSSRQATP